MIGLHQHADDVLAAFAVNQPRGAADTAFEIVADHTRPPTDVALFNRAVIGDGYRLVYVVFGQVKGINVTQPAVIRFGHDGQLETPALVVFDIVPDQSVAHHANL